MTSTLRHDLPFSLLFCKSSSAQHVPFTIYSYFSLKRLLQKPGVAVALDLSEF